MGRERRRRLLTRYFRLSFFLFIIIIFFFFFPPSWFRFCFIFKTYVASTPLDPAVWCLPLELSSPSLHPRDAQGAPKPHQVPQGLSAMQKWSCQGELGCFLLYHVLVQSCLGSIRSTNNYDRAYREPRAHSPFPCEAIHPWLADHPGPWKCHGNYYNYDRLTLSTVR